MKTLMSQSAFAKYVSSESKKISQQRISKMIEEGKLPAQNGKLIMPDAEKAYHVVQAGINMLHVAIDEPQSKPSNRNMTAGSEIQVDKGKWSELKFNDYTIHLCNAVEPPSVEVSNESFIVGVETQEDYDTANIVFRQSDDYVGFKIVSGELTDEVLTEAEEVEGYGENYFVITQAEIIEFLKQRRS